MAKPTALHPFDPIDLEVHVQGLLNERKMGDLGDAASLCLELKGHPETVILYVEGFKHGQLLLKRCSIDEELRDAHNDLDEAAEDGACAIGIRVAHQVLDFKNCVRMAKGNGFDFMLSDKKPAWTDMKARLEISGIQGGSKSRVSSRVIRKKDQMKDYAGLPGYVAVVEFSRPVTRLELKNE